MMARRVGWQHVLRVLLDHLFSFSVGLCGVARVCPSPFALLDEHTFYPGVPISTDSLSGRTGEDEMAFSCFPFLPPRPFIR